MFQNEKQLIEENSPLIDYLKRQKGPVLKEELSYEIESQETPDPLLSAALKEMERINAYVAAPLFTKERMIGLFTLGKKVNDEIYDEEDLEFLKVVSNQLAIALEKAKLHEDMLEAQAHLLQADKLASLGTIAAGMAHEIKNPLMSIKGMTEVMVRAMQEGDSETLEDFKKVVPKELDRINKLVENLLAYSRPPRPNKVPIDLNLAIKDILKLFEAEFEKKNIEAISELSGLPEKELDPEQMKQVFTNFILNAVQAMPQGGKLTIKSYPEEQRIRVEIIDTGVGIEQEKLKNIFDPFWSTKEKGAGLGLAITYKIIEEHGGKVTVQSEVGKGTVFSLLL